ncbi:DUF3969 family protein [Clostridium intestinale]|uniref:DUF3969 family protein n=2 Tax=Clostridium intestinale TaxID=36845 RepID=U2Q285_9CLOT|nr:DUF3969 family protein [Clostridium intestinale]ERK30169.1 hypothetical protein CINTURNW_2707 [Clostridium intestinale URNW]QLY81339.1 DUF3969 family protein [Clostridium intestinale]
MEEIKISIRNKSEIERFVLLSIVGLMDSLIEGAISIEDCEVYLCSPYSVEKLNSLKIDERVIELVEDGCELEDIESLIPSKLQNSINEIRLKAIKLLLGLPREGVLLKKWID